MDKQTKIFIGATGVVLVLIIVGLAFFVLDKKSSPKKQPTPVQNKIQEQVSVPKPSDAEIQSQLDQLEDLRKQEEVAVPTDTEVKKQLDDLETLRKQANVKPPTEAEIQAQLKQLEELRKKSK